MLLKDAGAPPSVGKAIRPPDSLTQMSNVDPKHLERLKDVVNTRMVVATLIAAMTFAAGFSVPGGYNDSGKDAGSAVLLNKPMYDIFVIFNTLGLCSSLSAVAFLHWSETNSLRAVTNARTSVVTALAATFVAHVAGVYVTISKRAWVAVVILIIGIAALFITLFIHIVFTPRCWMRCWKVATSNVKSFDKKTAKLQKALAVRHRERERERSERKREREMPPRR